MVITVIAPPLLRLEPCFTGRFHARLTSGSPERAVRLFILVVTRAVIRPLAQAATDKINVCASAAWCAVNFNEAPRYNIY